MVVARPKAVVEKPRGIVEKPRGIVEKPKAILRLPPYEREGVGGASSPSFPATQEIIAASPTTGEVLVRDIETREQSWQPATRGQITKVTEAVKRIEAGERVIYPSYKPVKIRSQEEAEAEAKKTGGIAYILPSGGWGVKPLVEAEVPIEKPGIPLKVKEREFVLPPGIPRKDITYTAKGEIEYYKRAGVRYYAPASTMWDLGFRTSTQHLSGDPAPYVAVTTTKGKVIHITQAESTKLSKLKGADLHHASISLGIIPKGTLYVDPAMQKKAIEALKPYALPDNKYDLFRAIRDKVTPAYLDALFGKKVVIQAKRDVAKWIAGFTTEQKALGFSDKRIAEQVAEIQSGKHLAYSPEQKRFIPTYREIIEQREITGYTPAELEEIQSAKYTTPHYETGKPVAVTKVQEEAFLALPKAMQKAAWRQGMSAIDLSGLKPEKQFAKMQKWGMIPEDAKFGGVNEAGEILLEDGRPWTERYLTAEMAKGVGIGLIPIAGTIYHWEHMPLWMKGASIVLDIATLIPVVGGVAIGVRGGKSITASIGRVALAEVKAPVTMITHPVATMKAMAAPAHLLLHPKRIPLAAAELRSYILKVPVKGIGEAKDAMKARDIITEAAIRGEKTVFQIGDSQIEMATVALQQKIAPAAVHTTYDLRPFLAGSKVQKGAEGLGLFVAPTMSTRLTPASAFGKGLTPAPIVGTLEWTGRHITKIGKYHPQDIAKLDLPPVRGLNLADAVNIPADIAPAFKAYIRAEKGTIVGSFTEWLKLPKAKRPNDIDLNFANPAKARRDIALIAEKAGYKVQIKESAILITKEGKTVEIANVKGPRSSFYKQHMLEVVPMIKIDGIDVIPLGEQYLRQGFGALGAGTDKATFAKRASHMLEAAPELRTLVKKAGFTEKMPGALIIRDEKILSQLQPSGKLWRGSAEIEKVIKSGIDLPPPSQIIQTVDEAGETLYLAIIGKPLSIAEITKLKITGSLDVVRSIFKTPIKIDKVSVKLMDEANDMAVTARVLELKLATAIKAGRTAKVATLRRELAAINSRARVIGRQIDLRVAGATSLRAIGLSTGDYIDRLSYRRLADANPSRLARLLRDMPARARKRVTNELTPRQVTRIKVEMRRLARSEVPRVPRMPEMLRVPRISRIPGVSRVPRVARVPREPRVPRMPGKPRVPRVPGVTRVPRVPRVPRVIRVPREPPSLVIPPGASDKEKRKAIKDSKGALAWRHGELHGKDVWHVGMYPYTSKEDFVTVIGRKPTNATIVKGPGSARQTIKLLYGKAPSKTVTGDIGFFDFSIKPVGRRKVDIEFTPDPKMETTGDITIGRRALPITERPIGLGRSRTPRITPKTPALRR